MSDKLPGEPEEPLSWWVDADVAVYKSDYDAMRAFYRERIAWLNGRCTGMELRAEAAEATVERTRLVLVRQLLEAEAELAKLREAAIETAEWLERLSIRIGEKLGPDNPWMQEQTGAVNLAKKLRDTSQSV